MKRPMTGAEAEAELARVSGILDGRGVKYEEFTVTAGSPVFPVERDPVIDEREATLNLLFQIQQKITTRAALLQERGIVGAASELRAVLVDLDALIFCVDHGDHRK